MFGGYQPTGNPMARERVNDLFIVELEHNSAVSAVNITYCTHPFPPLPPPIPPPLPPPLYPPIPPPLPPPAVLEQAQKALGIDS